MGAEEQIKSVSSQTLPVFSAYLDFYCLYSDEG